MKVILINGSPREKGCTYTALSEMAGAFDKNGIETEIVYIGSATKADDKAFVKEVAEKVENAQGIVIGSPVYYAAPTGIISTFMTNLMGRLNKEKIRMMPACSIASARRAGTTVTIDQLNKFFTISQMPVVSSNYWPMVHGNNPEEVKQDLEGLQIMRVLANNMSFMIKAFDNYKENLPESENKVRTNFIR